MRYETTSIHYYPVFYIKDKDGNLEYRYEKIEVEIPIIASIKPEEHQDKIQDALITKLKTTNPEADPSIYIIETHLREDNAKQQTRRMKLFYESKQKKE